MQPNLKITGETQEVCSDKKKPIEDRKEREEIENIARIANAVQCHS